MMVMMADQAAFFLVVSAKAFTFLMYSSRLFLYIVSGYC